MKRKLIVISALLAVVLAFGMFSGFAVVQPESIPETPLNELETVVQGLERVQVNATADTGYAGVETPDGKTVYYNPADGQLYTADGEIVIDSVTGTAINYMADAKTFKNSLGETMTLLQRSGGGAFDLSNGEYKVDSVKMADNLFVFNAHAGSGKFSKPYPTLVHIRVIKTEWWETIFLGTGGYIEYYNMRGQRIAADNLIGAVEKIGFSFNILSVFAMPELLNLLKFLKHLDTNYYGTFKDALEEVRVEFEQSESKEGFALNPLTNDFLRSDLGDKILLGDNFQLLDIMGWALIGADAYPVFWDVENNIYKNYSNIALTINNKNELVDVGGVVVRSVLKNIMDGVDLYCLYLADGVTFLPVTIENGVDIYDLNGKKVDSNILLDTEIAGYEENQSFLDKLLSALGLGSDGLAGCNGFTWFWTVLIVLAVLIGVVIIIKFLKWVIGK